MEAGKKGFAHIIESSGHFVEEIMISWPELKRIAFYNSLLFSFTFRCTGRYTNTPRQQVNKITSYIDGSVVYGESEERNRALREFKDGKMKVGPGDLIPVGFAALLTPLCRFRPISFFSQKFMRQSHGCRIKTHDGLYRDCCCHRKETETMKFSIVIKCYKN